MILPVLRRLSGLLASFKAPGFWLFYTNSTFAAVDMSVRTAVHGWLVLELSNDSELWVGIQALASGLGQILFSLAAGALVDRFQRRTVLIVEGALGAIIAFSLAAAVYLDAVTLWLAVAVAFLIGCLRAVRFTAANRYVYDLVGPWQLVNGAALWRVSLMPMMVFGSIAAGMLIERSGIWAAYGFMGVSMLLALPFLVFITVRGRVEPTGTNLLRQMAEGVDYAARSRPLRTLFTMSIVMESLGFAFLIMIPVMAKNELHAGAAGMGFIQAGAGMGMFLAPLVMAIRGDAGNKPRTIFLNALAAGVALVGFALSRSLLLSVLLAMVTMALLNAYDLTLGALMQLVAPPHLRGRAVGLHSLAISFTAVGGFALGAVGSVVGVPATLAAGGAGIVVNALLRRPALMRIREHSAVSPAADAP